MSDHARMPHADALALAHDLVARLAPVCERVEIAGSLRRETETVGDIDLVVIPRLTHDTDLFGQPLGEPTSRLDPALAELAANWLIKRWHKNGPALKSFEYGHGGRALTVELAIVRPETWAVMFMIKTGNAVFSHWLVTAQTAGGALPFGCQVRDGRLWRRGAAVVTPEEADLFAAIDLPYVPPAERSALDWFVRGRAQGV